jgi:hypothetical protein
MNFTFKLQGNESDNELKAIHQSLLLQAAEIAKILKYLNFFLFDLLNNNLNKIS